MASIISNYFPQSSDRPPGRPTPDDDTLRDIRNDLVHLFSVSWAAIGWQLRHADSREDLRRAFEPLRGENNDHLVTPFLKTTPLAAKGPEVRSTRRVLGRVVKRRYEAQANCNDPVRMYCEAETAVMEAQAEQLWKVRGELLKRQSALLAARKELHSAEELEQSLQKQLNELETSFAQEELVRILVERRCARNPLRLANAMAGLPYLTARVSYDRCSKIECNVWPKFDFQVFQKIESIWNSRERYRGLSIVELYRQEIKKLSRTFRRNKAENYLRKRLAENFGCLKLAIERGVELGVDPDRMPFIILSNFEKNREAPTTALTRTLAASERID
jgi:hypothetical protein